MLQEALLVVVGVAGGGLVAWLVLRRPASSAPVDQFRNLEKTVTDRLDRVTDQLDARLRENARAMNESKSFLADRVSATEKTVRSVSMSLGKLEEATAALHRTNQEIASFQQMLRSPKVRGSFGEVLLGNLLGAVLPTDRFSLQYTLPSSGEIADAVIQLQDGYCVCIDAKFPLASYEAYSRAGDDISRKNARTQFLRDVKRHVSDIAKKYIAPQDKTLDIAFMYIPLEAVYYEAIVRDSEGEDLWEYCLKTRVFPVSPNSFLAYLQTVLVGLKGMKIQQQAQDILRHLSQIRQDFGKFNTDFAMIGSHLTNAKNRYDDSQRRLDKFSNRLEQIDTASTDASLPERSPE